MGALTDAGAAGFVEPAVRRRSIPFVLFSLSLLFAFIAGSTGPAHAADLYTGEAPVANQDEAERVRALGPAFAQVLARVSGDGTIAQDPRLAAVLEQAPSAAKTWSFRQDSTRLPDGSAGSRTTLVAQFDPDAVARALAATGRGVWTERPRTLVWLVIDDGTNKRIASAAQIAALSSLTGRARERGIDIVLPQMDTRDTAAIDAETLWSGAPASALAAASRYATTALVAKLRRDGSAWQGTFALLDGGPPATWSASNADAATLLSWAASGLADRLAQRYTISPADRVAGDYRVWLSDLRGAADYGDALAYLSQLSYVDTVVPEGADGKRVLLKLRLNVRLERMAEVLALGDVLEWDAAGPADGAQATFRLRH
jgi:uncharacterized protein